MSTVGFLESLGGFRGIVTGPVQYYAGWLSDRLGRKPFMLLANFLGVLGVSLFIVAAVTGNWLWLVPGIALTGATLMADPVDQSVVAESTETSQRGTAYSLLMMAAIAPGIFAPTLGGWLATQWGFVPVFVLQAILYALGLLVVLRFLRELLVPRGERFEWSELKDATVRLVVPPRGLRGYYLTMAADSFAWGLGFALLFGMLAQTFGVTTFQLGLMSSLMALTWTLSQWPVGKVMDRFGSKPLMVFSQAAGVPLMAGFMTASSFPAFAALWACMGLLAATWIPAQRVMLANSISQRGFGEALGRLAAFQALLGFPAPFIGGLLYDTFGYQAPFLASIVGILVTTVLLVVLVREPRRQVADLPPYLEDTRPPTR
jgi:MFS family permease